MVTRIYLLIFFISVVCCKTSGNDNNESNQENEKVRNYVKNFYTWYLTKIYKPYKATYFLPSYAKKSEMKYVFDITTMTKKLRSTGYFTERFISNDSLRVSTCNIEMLKQDWESEPEPEFNIKLCNFLWKDRIVGGQGENLDRVEVREVTALGDSTFLSIVDIFEKEKKLYSAKVQVKALGDQGFQIDNVEVEWVRYK